MGHRLYDIIQGAIRRYFPLCSRYAPDFKLKVSRTLTGDSKPTNLLNSELIKSGGLAYCGIQGSSIHNEMLNGRT